MQIGEIPALNAWWSGGVSTVRELKVKGEIIAPSACYSARCTTGRGPAPAQTLKLFVSMEEVRSGCEPKAAGIQLEFSTTSLPSSTTHVMVVYESNSKMVEIGHEY